MVENARPGAARARTGLLVGGGAALTAVTVTLALLARADVVATYTLSNLVIGVSLLVPGAVIGWFRPGHVVGTLLVASGFAHLISAAATMSMLVGLRGAWPDTLLRALSTVSTGAWQLGLPLLFPLALLLFPDGRLPGRRWTAVAVLVVVAGGYQALTGVLTDGSVLGDSPRTRSILSLGAFVPDGVSTAAGTVYLAVFPAVMAALVVRYVRGDARTRGQLQWLILAVIAALLINAQRFVTADGPILLLVSVALVPVAIGIAIVRHELLDIRLVLSRALLYALALSVVVAVYAGAVAVASLLVPSDGEKSVSIGAAILVAIGFSPLRTWLGRHVERLFYGSRADPVGTARQVGTGLRAEDLSGALERASDALRLPWLQLRREPDEVVVAVAGEPDQLPSASIPIDYRGESAGRLVVGLRRGESELHSSDRRVLELIATPLAVALHATSLREQVQRARTALVEAGEAERVRLQRDLHDGLGPLLASIAFRADAASNLLPAGNERAGDLLQEVRSDLRTVMDEVRRVVHGLRPVALDELGLVDALRQHVARLPAGSGGRLSVAVEAPAHIPPLSPAVALAAYRIADEALTNVLRHSAGSSCRIQLSADHDLVLTVSDDGTTPASWQPGVGLRSMSERADELGGAVTAGPVPGGWAVTARLPLPVLSPLEA